MAEVERRIRLEHDDRRERILAAAQALFAHHRYESVSTTDVAVAAGTTRTNVHYYFGTKRNLYIEVVTRFARLPLPADGGSRELTREEAVDDLFGRWLDLVEDNEETFLVLMRSQASSQDPELVVVLNQSLLVWENRLLKTLGQPLNDPKARARIRAFQSLVTAACDQWLRAQALTKQDVREMLTRSLLAQADPVGSA